MQGIAAGIENTNSFVTTTGGRYVLTLFEKLTLDRIAFLSRADGAPGAAWRSQPGAGDRPEGRLFSELNGKPAALMSEVARGSRSPAPTPAQCGEVGATLAEIHLAGQSYPGKLDNPRGPRWWREAASQR